MQQESQFENGRGCLSRIHGLISDLNSSVAALEADIQAEEERTGISNPAETSYPMIARHWRQRRDNLLATIAALDRQFSRQQISADLALTA